jgi:nicotinamide mononucleotide adenylyltransferase
LDILVILSGRFHPFHKGHKSSYDLLADEFGEDSVYIATSDVQAPVTSPFSFSDKVKMMTSLDIPSSHIVKTINPYSANEITDNVTNPEDTILIFAVSEKDMGNEKPRFKFGKKKDGSPTYFQKLPDDLDDCLPMTEHGYIITIPTIEFKILDKEVTSASELRKMYIDSDDNSKENIIVDLYGEYDPAIKEIFDKKLEVTKKAADMAAISKDKEAVNQLSESQKQRLSDTLESILLAESKVKLSPIAPKTKSNKNYRSER